MNKLFNVLCLISLLTFSFISCSDDDDNDFFNSVETLPTDIAFLDVNLKGGEISGELTWKKPINTSELSSIVIYASNDGTTKEARIDEVSIDKDKYTVEARNYTKYLLLVPKNKKDVEGSTFAKVEITDETGNNVVTDLTFEDTDYTKDKIAGK